LNRLDNLEALAEQLIEGTFERLFRPRLHPSELARRLARAMEDGRVASEAGVDLLPNRYWVFLNPDDFSALRAEDRPLRVELQGYLERLSSERGGRFSGELSVDLHASAELGAGQLEVRAAHTSEAERKGDTHGVQVTSLSAAQAARWSLVLGGRWVRMGEPVVRLGRALTNDVILEDQRVSRRHAQLRWRGGTYQLSDIGSSGGTRLNGEPVYQDEEVPLADGDMISLAGVTLTVHVEPEPPDVAVAPSPVLPAQNA